ncbi:hypothetical protein BDV23DRAFT_185405 [Aspergillus alliaceus]|uniref:Major facilitator superfamily (MFS) profile domain-containing protein n=1 Tax=Petromyces alliaceus TaxID=209559 RepID=A0A5N7C302_PETAA|nr:hypothetical protein BDV23DRAFT_185405 [Aspergillus alliaceus]
MCAYFKNFIALSKLFGYDQGVMGVIVADQRFKDLMCPKDSWVTGAMASMYDVCCFIGAMSTGSLSDRYGRERMLAIASVVFIIGAVLQTASYIVIVGRIVLGYGVGGCAAGVPLCQSEIAPPTLRGSLIGIEQMVLCTSDLFAFWMKYAFDYLPTKDWWRIPPRWLVSQDRHDCAREVLIRLHGHEAAAVELERSRRQRAWRSKHKHLGEECLEFLSATDPPWLRNSRFSTDHENEFNLVLRSTEALPIHEPLILATGDVEIALFISSWIPIFFFDRLGRKVWLEIGTIGMMLAMVGIAVLQWHAGENPGSKGNYAIVVFHYLFYVFFNISSGVAVWTYPSEIFPLSMRAKGNALATSASWTMCYIVAQASPPIADAIGWGLYVVYAAICVIAFIFVRFALVETRNRSLEDMNRLFCLEGYFAAGEAAAAEQTFAAKDTSVEHIERSSNVAGPA